MPCEPYDYTSEVCNGQFSDCCNPNAPHGCNSASGCLGTDPITHPYPLTIPNCGQLNQCGSSNHQTKHMTNFLPISWCDISSNGGDGCSSFTNHQDPETGAVCTSNVGGEAGAGGYCNEDSDCNCSDGWRCCFCVPTLGGFEPHSNRWATGPELNYTGKCASRPYYWHRPGTIVTDNGGVWFYSSTHSTEKCNCDWHENIPFFHPHQNHPWVVCNECYRLPNGAGLWYQCGGDGFVRTVSGQSWLQTTVFTDTIDEPDKSYGRGACCFYDNGFSIPNRRHYESMLMGQSGTDEVVTCLGYLTQWECEVDPAGSNTQLNRTGLNLLGYHGTWLGRGSHCGQCNGVCSGPNGQFDSSGLSESDCTAKWNGTGVQLDMTCPGNVPWNYDLCYSDPCDGDNPPPSCIDKRIKWGACCIDGGGNYGQYDPLWTHYYNCTYTTESSCEYEANKKETGYTFTENKTCKEVNYCSVKGACCSASESLGGFVYRPTERWNPRAGHVWYNGFRESSWNGIRNSVGVYLGGSTLYDDYEGFVDRPCHEFYFASYKGLGHEMIDYDMWHVVVNYWGDGVSVDDVDCSLSVEDGACCQSSGECTNGSLEDCGQQNGLFLGGFTNCNTNPCPNNCTSCEESKGACCVLGFCHRLSLSDCDGVNGIWLGVESCDGVGCNGNGDSCCDLCADGFCCNEDTCSCEPCDDNGNGNGPDIGGDDGDDCICWDGGGDMPADWDGVYICDGCVSDGWTLYWCCNCNLGMECQSSGGACCSPNLVAPWEQSPGCPSLDCPPCLDAISGPYGTHRDCMDTCCLDWDIPTRGGSELSLTHTNVKLPNGECVWMMCPNNRCQYPPCNE